MKFNLKYYVKPWVMDLKPYVPGKTIESYIKLASNENNYGPSPLVMDILENKRNQVNLYPHRGDEVKNKIANYCNVKKENILLGNGSDEIIDLILKTFKGPVISFYPTFSEYEICTKTLGGEYINVNLNSDLSLPVDDFIEKLEEANVIFLCSPNNPTGTVIQKRDIKKILNEGKITVVDEAYYEFYGKTMAPLIKKYKNLIVLRTFAKAFALAGLRIGYAIGHKDTIEVIQRVKPPFNVNSLAQYAAIAALNDIRYMQTTVNRIKKDREALYNILSEKFNVIKSEANFILVDVSPVKSNEFYDALLKKRIIVRPFGRFRNLKGEYVRISVGTRGEIRKFISVLSKLGI